MRNVFESLISIIEDGFDVPKDTEIITVKCNDFETAVSYIDRIRKRGLDFSMDSYHDHFEISVFVRC